VNRETLLRILERARWAPSGDNTQPWRFEITAPDTVIVHGHDTRDHVLYDFDGYPSHIAHGALLETMRISASDFGLAATWTVESDAEARNPCYKVIFSKQPVVLPDPLSPFIEHRVVQRRPMHAIPLAEEQRTALVASVGEAYSLNFFSDLGVRWRVAKLLWSNAQIRLTCREAYAVHREIIEWGARYSDTKVPEQAVGVDPITARLMRWVMQSWSRVDFFNRFLLGTYLPRIELDLLPALLCSSHVLISPRSPPVCLQDRLELGRTVQRFWLTATQLDLQLQPQMTPVIFRWYVQSNRAFSSQADQFARARQLAQDFERLVGCTGEAPFGFFCRIGFAKRPSSRSTRMALPRLYLGK